MEFSDFFLIKSTCFYFYIPLQLSPLKNHLRVSSKFLYVSVDQRLMVELI